MEIASYTDVCSEVFVHAASYKENLLLCRVLASHRLHFFYFQNDSLPPEYSKATDNILDILP